RRAAGRGHEGSDRTLPRRQHHQAARAARGRRRWRASRLRSGGRQGPRPPRRGHRRRVRPAGRGRCWRLVSDDTPAPVPLYFGNPTVVRELLGQHDEHVKLLERELGVRIQVDDGTLTLDGDAVEVELAQRTLTQLYGLLEQGYPIYAADVEYALRILSG